MPAVLIGSRQPMPVPVGDGGEAADWARAEEAAMAPGLRCRVPAVRPATPNALPGSGPPMRRGDTLCAAPAPAASIAACAAGIPCPAPPTALPILFKLAATSSSSEPYVVPLGSNAAGSDSLYCGFPSSPVAEALPPEPPATGVATTATCTMLPLDGDTKLIHSRGPGGEAAPAPAPAAGAGGGEAPSPPSCHVMKEPGARPAWLMQASADALSFAEGWKLVVGPCGCTATGVCATAGAAASAGVGAADNPAGRSSLRATVAIAGGRPSVASG